MRLKEPLNFAGRLYEAGENVKGKLPLDMILVLKDSNQLLEVDSDVKENVNASEHADIEIQHDISLEEFQTLKAEEQKAHLKELGIDSTGKEEDRIAKYLEWINEQAASEDHEETTNA